MYKRLTVEQNVKEQEQNIRYFLNLCSKPEPAHKEVYYLLSLSGIPSDRSYRLSSSRPVTILKLKETFRLTFTDALPHAATTCHRRFIYPRHCPGPSQNRACAIYAHGSSSVHSPRREQVYHNPWLWKGESFQKQLEFLPRHISFLPTPVEPLEE